MVDRSSKTSRGRRRIVYSLMGNHEIMNMKGTSRDISDDDKISFCPEDQIKSIDSEENLGKRKKKQSKVLCGEEYRKAAFSKDEWIGKYLRGLDITATVDGTVFVHGGITEGNYGVDIEKINITNKRIMDENEPLSNNLYNSKKDTPLWYRGYYKGPDNEPYKGDEQCSELNDILNKLGAKRMVMGHSITQSKRIETRCEGRAVFIDTGISRKLRHPGKESALEIVGDKVYSIYMNGKKWVKKELNPASNIDTAEEKQE